MCNAYNHDYSCPCGFGGGGYGGYTFGSSDHLSFLPLSNVAFESFIYKTKCPVCGEGVYFYRSPYDGRVFFDELGPPWPKHPCTDTSLHRVSVTSDTTNYSPKTFLTNKPPHTLPGFDIFIVDVVYEVPADLFGAIIEELYDVPTKKKQKCLGRAIRIKKRRKIKIIKKDGSSTGDEYEYNVRKLELTILDKAPFLQAGKLAYISQDIKLENLVEITTFEVNKTGNVISRVVKAKLEKILRN